ncbi:MAG: multicopper oxidase family protein [Gemmatimonadota bacterium]|jgi:suppressor of ftsI
MNPGERATTPVLARVVVGFILASSVGAALSVAPLGAQMDQMDHGAHGMEMSGGWRMPPMNMEMPMLPGLEGVVPVVRPMLPGEKMDLASLPEAVPSRVVSMADGDTLDISVSMVRRTLAGQTLAMFGYNGQYPGPLIQAPRDATLTIRVTNDIQMPTTVHWHGIRLDNAYDGVPGVTQDPIGPGGSFTYQVRVPDAGMFWYHPHMREDVQQDLGLFGNLLVTSPDPDHYGPMHREEILVLDDLLLDDQGLLPYGEESPTHALMGRFGNVLLVNGGTDGRLDVRRGEVVRFYLTNVANTRTFNLRIEGARMKVVASDVSRYEREQWVESVVIAPAERYIVDVRFPESGRLSMVNAIQAVDHVRGVFEPRTDTLMRITVAEEEAAPDLGDAFETLRHHPEVEEEVAHYRDWVDREPDHRLETTVRIRDLPLPIVQMMEMDTLYVPPLEWNDGMPMMNWLSTGEQVEWILRDPDTGAENGEIDWRFQVGDVVKVRVHNPARSFHPMQHPFHIHGQRFVVLAMDGVTNPNMVWKDTAIIPVGSTVDLVVEMSNPGTWMAHCHIAEHLHTGMMFGFTVE